MNWKQAVENKILMNTRYIDALISENNAYRNMIVTDQRPQPAGCPNKYHSSGLVYNTELDRAQCPICLYTLEEEMGG